MSKNEVALQGSYWERSEGNPDVGEHARKQLEVRQAVQQLDRTADNMPATGLLFQPDDEVYVSKRGKLSTKIDVQFEILII